MIRWSVVFFIWAVVALVFGLVGTGPVVSDVSWIFFLLFTLLFLFFSILGVANARPARARIRP